MTVNVFMLYPKLFQIEYYYRLQILCDELFTANTGFNKLVRATSIFDNVW